MFAGRISGKALADIWQTRPAERARVRAGKTSRNASSSEYRVTAFAEQLCGLFQGGELWWSVLFHKGNCGGRYFFKGEI